MDQRKSFLAAAAALLVVIIAVVLIAGTGDSDEEEVAEVREKPTIEVPDGDPPNRLQIEDIEVGDGEEAESGDTVRVNYVGVLFENGEEFDSSFSVGQPAEFALESGGLIEGWVRGMEGMRVGGRRELIIPPQLAYGEDGAPPSIPPDATLVFVIDLLEIVE